MGYWLTLALITAAVCGAGWGVLALYERAEERRTEACVWMERPDPYHDATYRQKGRNRALLLVTMGASGLALAAPWARDMLGVPVGATLAVAGVLFALFALPYAVLPILDPKATALSDVLASTTGHAGPDALRMRQYLSERLLWNETMETASPRAKVVWERACNAIIANDTSYSARNREIAELQRCIEAGYPLPKFMEARARREHERQWNALMDLTDE